MGHVRQFKSQQIFILKTFYLVLFVVILVVGSAQDLLREHLSNGCSLWFFVFIIFINDFPIMDVKFGDESAAGDEPVLDNAIILLRTRRLLGK